MPESPQSTCHHVSAVTRSVFSSHANAVLLESRPFCTLAVSSLLSLLSELRQTSRATRKLAGVAPRAPVTMFQQSRDQFFSSHPNAVLLQSRQFCTLAVSSLQSLLSEPLLIANMSEKRAIAGSKHAGLPQTCPAASKHAGLAFEHLSPKRNTSECDCLQKETLPTYSLQPQVAYRDVLDQTRKTGETKATKKGGWLDVE